MLRRPLTDAERRKLERLSRLHERERVIRRGLEDAARLALLSPWEPVAVCGRLSHWLRWLKERPAPWFEEHAADDSETLLMLARFAVEGEEEPP